MKTLGLDLGTNSIGWAFIDYYENEDNEKSKIIDMGVKIFEAGLADMGTSKEKSRNAQRREARLARRQRYRRIRRKKKLLHILFNLGFLKQDPFLNPKENIFSDYFNSIIKNTEPYSTRKKTLDEQISLEELSRIFYHLCQRRGFKSNRKFQSDDKTNKTIEEGDKEKKILGVREIKNNLKGSQFRTVGEYFASLDPHINRIRSRYVTRDLYSKEFDEIWEKQKEYYPDLLNEENYKLLKYRVIYFQRDLKSQKSKIGRCEFEPLKRRALISSLQFQEFRLYQMINNVNYILRGKFYKERYLDIEQRQKLFNYLQFNSELKLEKKSNFKKFKEIIGISQDDNILFNYSHLTKLKGNTTLAQIKSVLGKNFDKYNCDNEKGINNIEMMWRALVFAKDNEWLIKHSKEKWGFDDETTEKFSKISLEKDYSMLSTRAIKKILPFLREGQLYNIAVENAGYKFEEKKVKILDKLPEPPKVANPTVMRTMHQLKNLVNSIIDKYGKPERIHVELGKELKNSKKKRLDTLKRNQEINDRHETIEKKLKTEFGIKEPKKRDLIKYKLWEDFNYTCPYSGRKISQEQLFRRGEVVVDHILPYDRTLDDSYSNKVICFYSENAEKGNRTPHEWLSSNPQKYSALLGRVNELDRAISYTKKEKFFIEELSIDGFLNSQLTDNAYIAKVAKNYLKHITPKIQPSVGQATSYLRHLWGMNHLLYQDGFENIDKPPKKNRNDHRHHSIDALVIALTSKSYLQRLSTYNRINNHLSPEQTTKSFDESFKKPWENFESDIAKWVENIIVYHKPKRRSRGQMHEETHYGKIIPPEFFSGNVDSKKKKTDDYNNIFAFRKPLLSMTLSEIKSINDKKVRALVLERLKKFNINIEDKNPKIPKTVFQEPIYITSKKGNKIIVNKARISRTFNNAINIRDYNVWVESGNNHHIVIYVDEKGKKCGKVVSLYEVYQRKLKGLSVIDTNLPPEQEFLYTLQTNDMVLWGNIPEGFETKDKSTYHLIRNNVYRVQKMDVKKNIILRINNITYTSDTDSRGVRRTAASTIDCNKLTMDHLGYIEIL